MKLRLTLCLLLMAPVGCTETDTRDLTPYETDAGGDVAVDADQYDVADDVDDAGNEDADSGDEEDAIIEDAGEDAEILGPCQFNAAGEIQSEQLPAEPGLSANFQMALDVAVDTAGSMVDGTQTWDLSENLPGDEVREVRTLDPAEQWFAEDYPDATHAVELSADSDLLGVFQGTDDALLLLGVVEPEDSGVFARTRLTYDPPITILEFPLEEDATWTTDSIVSGSAQGVVAAYSEDYSMEVDARGEMITPFGTFPVLRVRTTMERSSSGFTLAESLTFAFVSPCFGTVATIVSEDGESETEFDQAAEVRRLTP